MRIGITGGPGTGKTTMSKTLGMPHWHTDDLMHLPWSQASDKIADDLDAIGTMAVIEGVALPRALRKWLASHPEGRPIDKLIVLNDPKKRLSPGQYAMTKGIRTVLEEIKPELVKRGVEIEEK